MQKPTVRHQQVPASRHPIGADLERAAGVDRWIAAYVPRSVPSPLWESTLRPFVVPALHDLAPQGIASASQAAWALTRLAAWCVGEAIPLDREVVLDPDTVERFTSVGLKGEPSRGTYRAILRRIGRTLTVSAPWEPLAEPTTHRAVALPYLGEEIDAIAQDACDQSNPARRRAARAMVALGAGAGLDGRWVTKVRGTDVIESPDALLVRVGPPTPRLVPVLAAHEDEARSLAAEAEDEYLVGGTTLQRNKASAIVARLEIGHGNPRLSCSRLRSTWLVHHLSAGTRLPELARAAGLSGVTVLSDLLEFVPPLPEAAAVKMLRGSP